MSHIDMTAIRHALAERKKHVLGASLSSVSLLALCVMPALAADYTATDDNSLRTYIGIANGDGDSSSTITLGNDVQVSNSALPPATKALTLDSGGFTFTRAYGAGTLNQGVLGISAATGTITIKGTVTGVNNGGNTGGQYGLFVSGSTVINDAVVTAAN